MKITKPTLLINETIARRNIQQFQEKAKRANILFRPHFKTHQSIEIGRWFRDYGIDKIAVSSVEMAQYFMQDQWNDITIAVPVNMNEVEVIDAMAGKISLQLIVDSVEALQFMENKMQNSCGIFLEIDTGYHRTGIESTNQSKIDDCIAILRKSEKLQFKGFLSHAGNTYSSSTKEEIRTYSQYNLKELQRLKAIYVAEFPEIITSYGDTPSLSISKHFEGCDEIRPGNFVLYDLMQYQLGVCSFDDIACVMACPVISKNMKRNEMVIYGGAIHFSKEYILDKYKEAFYGLVCKMNDDGTWQALNENHHLSRVSQEHGVIKASSDLLEQVNIGDIIGVVPVHSCLAVNLMGMYTSVEGKKISTIRFFH